MNNSETTDNTVGILFAGGGIGTIGAIQAGLKPLWSIEYDPKIAEVHRLNHSHPTIVSKVEDVDISSLPRVDWLLMSPVCTRASRGNTKGVENEIDINAARACCRYIIELKPNNIVLENVWQYRNFESFKLICTTLESEGYTYKFDHVCAADHGVPQSRWRLILRAVKGRLLPELPQKTPRLGWYQAVSDLLDGCEDTQFAKWQSEKMPEYLKTVLVNGNTNSGDATALLYVRSTEESSHTVTCRGLGRDRAYLAGVNGEHGDLFRSEEDPSPSVCCAHSPSKYRALLVSSTSDMNIRDKETPAGTVLSNDHQGATKALLIDVRNANRELTCLNGETRSFTVLGSAMRRPQTSPVALLFSDRLSSGGTELAIADGETPCATVTVNSAAHPNRALLVHPTDQRTMPVRDGKDPSFTVMSNFRGGNEVKAFVIDGQSNKNGETVTCRTDGEPMYTVSATCDRRPARAFTGYRIVKLSARCLARFQTIPDNYILPENNKLAATIIGNGVPCEMQRRIIKSMM